jgi:hypothetical protein
LVSPTVTEKLQNFKLRINFIRTKQGRPGFLQKPAKRQARAETGGELMLKNTQEILMLQKNKKFENRYIKSCI